MNFEHAYLSAVDTIGRRRRKFEPVYPQNWQGTDQPACMLVLTGGWVFDFGDWPAFAFVLPQGNHTLGGTLRDSAFPKSSSIPKLFEGSQCLIQVGKTVEIAKDYSTNGTVVVPAEIAKAAPDYRLNAELRGRFDLPCPKPVNPHDLLLTQYAELVMINVAST